MSDESRIADLITTIKRNERNATLDEVTARVDPLAINFMAKQIVKEAIDNLRDGQETFSNIDTTGNKPNPDELIIIQDGVELGDPHE